MLFADFHMISKIIAHPSVIRKSEIKKQLKLDQAISTVEKSNTIIAFKKECSDENDIEEINEESILDDDENDDVLEVEAVKKKKLAKFLLLELISSIILNSNFNF